MNAIEKELAADRALLEVAASGGRAGWRTWQLDSYAVVAGRGSDIEADIDTGFCAGTGIPVVRRFSGGGTVLVGPGTLQWAIALPEGLLDGDGHLLDVLFGGLEEAPFVDLAPLPVVFNSISTLDPDTIPLEALWPEPVTSAAAKVRDRGLVEVTIEAYESLVGGRRPEIAHLDDLLEATAAAELDTGQGEPYLRAVYDAIVEVLDAFEAPGDQNVRLTSRRATVPFTIENGLSVPVRVRLHLESDGRLDFPDGDTLDATLSPGSNRIPILVEARTSGDARLQVTVRSPDPSELLQLQSSTLLVRSTQLSGVGVLLLAGALLVLGAWWFRSVRNGRPAPSDDYAAPDPGEDP